MKKARIEDLILIEEIGEKIAKSVVQYFNDPINLELISRLEQHGIQMKSDKKAENHSGSLDGLSFVISGTFTKFSRDKLKELIEDNGGKNLSGISSKTNFLVSGENTGPSKLQKAQELNINIISEQELLDMIG